MYEFIVSVRVLVSRVITRRFNVICLAFKTRNNGFLCCPPRRDFNSVQNGRGNIQYRGMRRNLFVWTEQLQSLPPLPFSPTDRYTISEFIACWRINSFVYVAVHDPFAYESFSITHNRIARRESRTSLRVPFCSVCWRIQFKLQLPPTVYLRVSLLSSFDYRALYSHCIGLILYVWTSGKLVRSLFLVFLTWTRWKKVSVVLLHLLIKSFFE